MTQEGRWPARPLCQGSSEVDEGGRRVSRFFGVTWIPACSGGWNTASREAWACWVGPCPASRGSPVLLNAELSPAPQAALPRGPCPEGRSTQTWADALVLPVMTPGMLTAGEQADRTQLTQACLTLKHVCIACVTLKHVCVRHPACGQSPGSGQGQLGLQGAWAPVPMMDFK